MKHPDTEFFAAVSDYRRLLICIKGSPDPDALAAAFTCKLLCEKSGKKCRIVATQKLALNQNRVFAKRLALPFELIDDFAKLADWAEAYLVLDHASPEVEGLSDRIPCAVHIDHHEPVSPPFAIHMRWCRTDVGSTSAMVAKILEATHGTLTFSPRDMQRMATALLFGIQTDTDHYALATKHDYAAVQFLSGFADKPTLRRLSAVPLGRSTTQRLQVAERNQLIYRDWLMAGVGFIPEKNRDDIAIIADLLLRREKVSLVVVFALVHNERRNKLTLDASVRSSDPNLKLSALIRTISSDGGGRKFKGAFQAKLDYFLNYSDRDDVWELVEKATIEKLKRTRDAHLKVKLQGLIENVTTTTSQLLSSVTGGARYTLHQALTAYRKRRS